jgi:hypothetical protein
MLLPACYENVFAFRPDQSCAAPIVPTSGLYIDDLEGISLRTVGSNGKHTYQNAQAVLNAKTVLALQKTEIWLQSVLQKRGFILPQLQPAANLCSYLSTTQTVAAGARGVTLYRRHGATNLANIYIDKVQYKAKTSGTATLIIQNTDGVTLYTSPANVVTADAPVTFVLLAYFSIDVRVLVITDTEPYDTTCDSSCGCLHSQNTAKHRRAAMYKVVGFDGTNDAASGFGVTVCAAVRCSIQSLMCYILDIIKMPLRLYVGIELLREFRANNAATAQNPAFYTKDIQKETMGIWQKEADYQLSIQIDTILHSLRDYDPYCISCHAPNRITIASLR